MAGSVIGAAVALAGGAVEQPAPAQPPTQQTRDEQNAFWIAAMVAAHHLSPDQEAAVRRVVDASPVLSQGNPALTDHPMTREQCRQKLSDASVSWTDADSERTCGRPFMAPLYDPASQTADDATVCIDRMEFPDLPCEYPVVWVRAREAQELCQAVGKRMCDAHEWEGACAGSLGSADYRWDLAKGKSSVAAVNAMRNAHNRSAERKWSYGSEFKTGICAQDSHKTSGCTGGSWKSCGSNTYPTGAFPACTSPLGVTDINGNAAEHMNLPLASDQLAQAGGSLGVTEMKGSWFIWDKYQAHDDWCRWRAPFWHGSTVMATDSHENYHLGFRCCADVAPRGEPSTP